MRDASKCKVLLVGWDAADWKVIGPLIDEGRMPHLARLIETGVMGNLATILPPLSPILWTSIATGMRPHKHGILGFSEPDPDSGRIRPITNLSRRVKALWNILHQEGRTCHVVGWWPSHPAEPIRGTMVSNHFQQAVAPLDKPWPMRPGTVHPPELAVELEDLRIHPHELDGDMLLPFVPRAAEIDQKKDKRLGGLAKIFAECSGIHAAATHLLHTRRDWDFAAVYYDAIDHFSHAFMRYHPPRPPWVSEADFNLYKEVVRGGYIYHDMMLGALRHLAGPGTTVIVMSDHGFHPDQMRPLSLPNEPAGPAAEHRPFGIFVAGGPGIREDGLVFGATILDVAPTILALFGLPLGRDMDGRALTSIVETAPQISYIDSWESREGGCGRHPPETRLDPGEAQAALRQLVDLGYIDEPDADAAKAADETVKELRYNLARALVDAGEADEAAGIFAELWDRWPEESRFGVHLLQTQVGQGLVVDARETMARLRERKATAAEKARGQLREMLRGLRERQRAEGVERPDGGGAEDAGTPAGPSTPNNHHSTLNIQGGALPRLGASAGDHSGGESEEKDEAAIDWEQVDERTRHRLSRLRQRAGTNALAFAFLEGSLLALERRHAEALEMFEKALAAQANLRPSVLGKMGEVRMAMRDWAGAARHFDAILELDPLSAQAHFGLARAAFAFRDFPRAAAEAQSSIGLRFHDPQAHFLAGLALWRCGKIEEAERSLHQAVALNPVFPAAQRTLARFYVTARRDPGAYLRHKELAREARRRIRDWRAGIRPEGKHPAEFRSAFGDWRAIAAEKDMPAAPALPPRAETVCIVTGLPRSGTSMLMQMLVAGGVPVLVDEHRPADDSNPRGYFEFEKAKRLGSDQDWLAGARGRVVKIVAQLIPRLPQNHQYRIVMMHRPLAEVAASQRKMLDRLGKGGGRATDEALIRTFQAQVAQVVRILDHWQAKGQVGVLHLKYNEVLDDPLAAAGRLAGLFGEPFDAKAAAAAVDPALYRERMENNKGTTDKHGCGARSFNPRMNTDGIRI
ncbi:MAG: alkaline phosphatase family protein [Verrucomicrobiae bacterium]|nr:alkaline phosphatase family protein [Verrucomicrobiae bacterium]